ncbi:FKBP-type peptidyl-prolyl cis-trans isomerase [Tellurirhabdus rosea]|uniref:FKBP-type peptidyl-prolyl cis-trans isomerase n=1 Tax=Tellurirhabdus rosea TaxID=2674997 RepID=UPI002B1CC9A1|nr:FKBP-type peptidyl-prolyl cis-trans isomerase [Tellurirhabdus rosea]
MKFTRLTLAGLLSAVFATGPVMAQTKKPVSPKAKPASAARPAPTGVSLASNMDSLSYSIGVSMAQSLKQNGLDKVNLAALSRGMGDAMKGQKTVLSDAQMQTLVMTYMQKQNEGKMAAQKEVADANKKAGDQFLEENKKKPGVQTTASGLQYLVVKEGTGPKPTATDKVKTHYHGTLIDGTVFDSSVQRGEPIEFPVNGVIQGWQEALQLMPVGSKWKLFIPADLAYGERGAGGPIGPNATLVFDIELLDIVKQ